MTPRIRQALPGDIGEMHRIRLAVRQNQLSDPLQISEKSYFPLVEAGGAWVAESGKGLAGFAIVDATNGNVWAVFVDPACEGRGVGRALHDRMVLWSSKQGLDRLWLTTGRGTRAEQFYRQLGWLEAGSTETGEIRFERQISLTRTP